MRNAPRQCCLFARAMQLDLQCHTQCVEYPSRHVLTPMKDAGAVLFAPMAIKTSLDDPFLPLAFSLFSNPGAYAVLAGAGVSRGAGLPTAWDIVVDLVARMAGDNAEIDSDTASGWYEARFGREPTYSDVVHQLALTRAERQTLLRKYFESAADSADPVKPSVAHRAVARLMQSGVIHVVLTVNFDRLFEQALQQIGIEPTVVATEADAQGLAPLHTLQHCIVHLHGDYLNAVSMRNTTAELAGYSRQMKALVRRVVTDYGLLVAGWSVEYDPALREAIAAHHPSRFTMGWVTPGMLGPAARSLTESKKALIFDTTADDAFGHLADEVESMRERHARHPLTLDVAVSRTKRQLVGARPSIGTHDMLAAEFARLRGIPALNRSRSMDSGDVRYDALLREITEACRVPVGVSAALAHWGDPSTDGWWLPEVERFGHVEPASGTVRLLHLPLVVATLLFYATGIAGVLGERFDLIRRLFDLRANLPDGWPHRAAGEVLIPTTAVGDRYPLMYDHIRSVVGASLSLDEQPVDDAMQLFEVLRLSTQLIDSDGFDEAIERFAAKNAAVADAVKGRGDVEEAWRARQRVLDGVAEQCHPYSAPLFAAERMYEISGGRRWGSPVAERLAFDIDRQGESHPVVVGLQRSVSAVQLAVTAVGAAIGRAGEQMEWQAIPVGTVGFIPSEFWLDRRPTT